MVDKDYEARARDAGVRLVRCSGLAQLGSAWPVELEKPLTSLMNKQNFGSVWKTLQD